MEFEEMKTLESSVETRNQKGARRFLNDRCLIWSTVILTAAYCAIAARVIVGYYNFCENNKNATECL